MRVEAPIDREALLETVRLAYGLEVSKLEYLGQGMVFSYRVEGLSGTYFLKLFPDTPSGREASARLEGEHSLLLALRETGVLERIPSVVRARDGSSRAHFMTWPFALYGFIDGETLWERVETVLPALASAVGRLHAGASRLLAHGAQLPVPEDDLGFPFEEGLLEAMARLERVGKRDRPGTIALAALLRPRRDELLGLLERARVFQRAARSRPRERVVAHTDLHGRNLLLDREKKLWLLDWETARLAPLEHDLWMFHAELEAFLPPYEAALGRTFDPDVDLFGFYIYRRNLEDLAVDVAAILNDQADDEQDLQDVQSLERHGLGAWPRLEANFQRVRAFLLERAALRGPS